MSDFNKPYKCPCICHGRFMKQPCNFCDCEFKNVSPLIEQVQKLEKDILDIKKHISESDIGLATWESEIVKELNHYKELISNHEHKIEHCYQGIEKCFERIEKLEQYCALLKINDLRETCVKLAQDLNENLGKVPHKCPLCNGYGSKHIGSDKCAEGPRNHYLVVSPCNSCEGKGIVWG